MAAIEPCTDVRTFFVPHVAEAMRDLRVQTGPETERYLVGLLSGFSVSERIHALSQPLAWLLQRARQAKGPEHLARMQDLGDIALFLCGFFPDTIDRRGLSQTYVVAMGGRAYLVLGENARTGTGSRVFAELAERFLDLARVLDEVRERTALCTDGAVLRLYERWCGSGSPALARRLARRGIQPVPPSSRGRAN